MGTNQGDDGTPISQRRDLSAAYWDFITASDFVASQIVHDTLNSLSTPDLELRSLLASQNTAITDWRTSIQSALDGIHAAQATLGRFRASTRLHHAQPQWVDFRKCANHAMMQAANVLSVAVSPLDLQQSIPIWLEIDKVGFESLCFLWMRMVRLTYLDSFRLSMELRQLDSSHDACELWLSTDVPLDRIRIEWLMGMPMSEESLICIEPPYRQFAVYLSSILHRIRAAIRIHNHPDNVLQFSIVFAGAALAEEASPAISRDKDLARPVRSYVLVVESNEYVRSSIVASLQAIGFGVIEATTSIEALQITNSFPFPFAGKIIDEQTVGLSLRASSDAWPDWFSDGVVIWTSSAVPPLDRPIPSDGRSRSNPNIALRDSVLEVQKPYSLEHILRCFVSRS